jgi:hypothetical protein
MLVARSNDEVRETRSELLQLVPEVRTISLDLLAPDSPRNLSVREPRVAQSVMCSSELVSRSGSRIWKLILACYDISLPLPKS